MHTATHSSNRVVTFNCPTFSTSFSTSSVLSNADYMIKNIIDQKQVDVVVKHNQSLYSSLYGENYIQGLGNVNNNTNNNNNNNYNSYVEKVSNHNGKKEIEVVYLKNYFNTDKINQSSINNNTNNEPNVIKSIDDMNVYGYANYVKEKFSGDITSFQSFDTTRKRSSSNVEINNHKKHTNGISRHHGDKSNSVFSGDNKVVNNNQNVIDNNEIINQNEVEKRTDKNTHANIVLGYVKQSEKRPRENNQNERKHVTFQNSTNDIGKKSDLFHEKENTNNNHDNKIHINTYKRQKITDTENDTNLPKAKQTSIFPNLKKVATKLSQGTVQMLKHIVFVPEVEEVYDNKCSV